MAGLARAVVLSENGEVESTTPGVELWLAELPDGDLDAGSLPSAVHAVAGREMRTAEGSEDPGEVALARVLSRSGTWIVLHGTSLVPSGSRRAAVIVEPAHPARITPLLMSAYGPPSASERSPGWSWAATRPSGSPSASSSPRTRSRST
jgi:hypothetical protein